MLERQTSHKSMRHKLGKRKEGEKQRERERERERETGANFIAEVRPIFHATKKCAEGQRSRSAITGSSTSLRGQANPGSRMRLPFFICWYLLAHQSEYATGGAGIFLVIVILQI